jgi:C_GCAxxG_C_C family probable redox protein
MREFASRTAVRMNEAKQEELTSKAYSLGFEYEEQYGGCAQCVIAALQDVLELRSEGSAAVFKAATSLEGGVGCEGDGHCGAYSGGVMMFGHIIGRERDNLADPQSIRKQTNVLAQTLHKRFIERYGTVICQGIHRNIFGRPYYLRDSTERDKFREAGGHVDKCTAVVGEAARWTVEILIEAGKLQ